MTPGNADAARATPSTGHQRQARGSRDPSQGWSGLLGGANGARSLVLAGGVALHAINVYIATTILPSAVSDIGGLDLYAWSTSLFVVASILGSALSARLLEGVGPRGAYVGASAIFVFGSVICGLAPSMLVMLAGRFVQGFGGGLLFALAYVMIRIVFDEALWPRAMALVSGMWGVATLVGPAIGGIFAEIGAWRAAFWSIIPIAAVFAGLAVVVLPRCSPDRNEPAAVPLAQLLLLIAAVLGVCVGSVLSEPAWTSAALLAAAALTFLLVTVERNAARRLLPSDAFRLRSRLAAIYTTMALLAVAVTSSEIFVPLFLQQLHRQTPLVAGYLAALMAGGWTAGSIVGAGAEGRNAHRMIRVAPLLAAAGMVALAILVPHASDGSWLWLAPMCGGLVVVGLGVGLGWPHLLTRVLQTARDDEQDVASASITTVQLFATAIGAALAGLVANLAGLTRPGGVVGASHAALALFVVFAFAPALGCLTARRVGSGKRQALIVRKPS